MDKLSWFIAFVLGLLLTAPTLPAAEVPRAAATPADDRALTSAINDFSIDLHKRLALKSGDGNLFSSPLSASSALAIAYAGARGRTAAQMEQALCLTGLADRVHGAFGRLSAELAARKDAKGYDLSIANAVWGQSGFPWLEAYRDLTAAHYGAVFREVDFKNRSLACQVLNKWASDNTNGKITKIIDERAFRAGKAVSDEADLFITNAVYFKGDWAKPFKEERTKREAFTLPGGGKVDCQMMKQMEDLSYADGDGFQAVSLPYKGGNVVMLVFLPTDEQGLGALEANLTSDLVSDTMRKLRPASVTLWLPKFKVTQGLDLGGELAAMGMTDAFDPSNADFTGMTSMRPCYIKSVVQHSYVDVNEKGTEAAAVTRITGGMMSGPPKPAVFRADHPFLFFIMDGRSKTILFVGRITDPTTEK